MRVATGLPVFLNESEALADLKNKSIRRSLESHLAGWAVLGQLEIPEKLIANNAVHIIRNSHDLDRGKDAHLQLPDLTAHRDGEKLIEGECHISSSLSVKSIGAVTLLVARAHKLNGEIDLSAPNPFIRLDTLVPDWHEQAEAQAEAYGEQMLAELDNLLDDQ